MKDSPSVIQQLAEAIWQRIRWLLKSQQQYESFVHEGQGLPVTSFQQLSRPEQMDQLAQDFTLHALNQLFQPASIGLLKTLSANPEGSHPARLASALDWSEPLVLDHLSQLLQWGLVDRQYQSEVYSLSSAGQALVAWSDQITSHLSKILQKELPVLLNEQGGRSDP